MPKRRVIKRSQLPSSLGIGSWIVYGLLLDRLNAPSWLWGVVGTIAVIALIGNGYYLMIEEEIELPLDKG